MGCVEAYTVDSDLPAFIYHILRQSLFSDVPNKQLSDRVVLAGERASHLQFALLYSKHVNNQDPDKCNATFMYMLISVCTK